jgi:predicted Zn-dependent peptidase
LAGLAAATMLAAAQKQAPPAPAKPRPFTLPKHETYALGNGMKVTLVPWGTLPVASVGVNLDFGNINESKDQVWMADFLAELMKEGAAGKSGAQLAKEAASLGGGLNFGAGPEESYASMNCLGEFAPKAVKLLSELLLKPDFPAGEVERLRGNLLRRAAVDRSQPQTLAYEAFNKAVYGEHRFGTMYPTPELLKSYTLDQLKKFHAANFGARRAHLYVAGQFDAAAVKQAVEGGLGGWAAGPAPVRKPPAPKAQKQFVLIDQPKAEQSNLYIGLPVAAHPAHPDYIPFQVLDAMLGGTFFSRITTNIREDKGYTYSPGSQVDNYRGSAVWIETADVSTNVTAESIREILKEVGQMRKEPPTEKELQAVKNALTGMFVLRNASPSGVINLLIMAERHGLGDDWLNSYIGKLNAVTRADVQRLAESMLDPAKMTIVVAGDREKIEKTLAPYKN